jgi:hypothetical protein
MISHSQFIELLLAEFPELTSEVQYETWAGLLHLETACFARRTQKAIDNREVEYLRRCFDFATRIFQDADEEVKNAMNVSYLENLNFTDGKADRSWAFDKMSPPLKQGWIAMQKYLDDLFSKRIEKHKK